MAIEFCCGQCGRVLRAGDGTEGQRTLCPGCGAFATVPAPEVDVPAAAAVPPESGPSVPPPVGESASPFATEPEDGENPYQAPTQYGAPATAPPYDVPVMPTDTRAVVSLVLGICGFFLFFCCPLMGLPVGVAGISLGVMALKSQSRGLAIAGIILSSIQLLLALLYVVAIAVFFAMAASAPGPPGW